MTLYLTSKSFDQNGIKYGFFGRKGGVSKGVYESLNAGFGSNDDRQSVEENRAIIMREMGVESLSTLYQIHSNICHTISAPLNEVVEADALVTSARGVAIGVLTADCGPILFHGMTRDNKPVIGAAHAGWGGAVKGILESTLDKMLDEGADLKTIKVMIGPCIGAQSYEVSPEFKLPFVAHDIEAGQFFKPSNKNNDKLLFDLPAYIEFRLRTAGVRTIIQSGIDTYMSSEDYFSFRRKTHNNEPDYGRQVAVIVIK